MYTEIAETSVVVLYRHDYTTKVCMVKAMVFLVVMYRCESWTIKKVEPKNWYFQTVVLEKTLESSLDSKEIQPVNPKGDQPWILIERTEADAQAPILWPPDMKSWFKEKTLMLGNPGDRRKREWQRKKWLDCMTNSLDVSLSKLREIVKDRETWCATVHGVTKSWTWLRDWITEDVCVQGETLGDYRIWSW